MALFKQLKPLGVLKRTLGPVGALSMPPLNRRQMKKFRKIPLENAVGENWYYEGPVSVLNPMNAMYHLFIAKSDLQSLRELVGRHKVEIWCDGTFSINHDTFKQCQIFHMKSELAEHRFYTFPFLFCLMEGKTEEIYIELSSHLNNLFRSQFNFDLPVDIIHCDSEMGFMFRAFCT